MSFSVSVCRSFAVSSCLTGHFPQTFGSTGKADSNEFALARVLERNDDHGSMGRSGT